MHAKIVSTTWEHNKPTRSEVSGTLFGETFEFEHELGCPMQGSTQDCICYVSRIRLVKTPVGRFIATTEPDLEPELVFWEARAKHWERQAWVARGLFLAMGIIGTVMVSL